MARLSVFKVDGKSINDGRWVAPGEDFEDLGICTRGFTDAYTNARAQRTRRAATQYGGDASRIPVEIGRSIMVDALIAHVLIDVRGLVDDAGNPILFPAFCDLLRNPDYQPLVLASLTAAGIVSNTRVADITEAAAVFGTPSSTS